MITPRELRDLAASQREASASAARAARDAARAAHTEAHVRFSQAAVDEAAFLDEVARKLQSAVVRGEDQTTLLQFPSAYCTDGGRAINNLEPSWPGTLSGCAERIYEIYRHRLAPLGYRLQALIADFPDGMPGEAKLILRW